MQIVIFITAADNSEAELLSRALVKNKLVACVNIVEKVQSLFWWQGKVDRAKEVLLIAKSRKANLVKIIKLVKLKHSYQVPEVIALEIVGGNRDYLKWIEESC